MTDLEMLLTLCDHLDLTRVDHLRLAEDQYAVLRCADGQVLVVLGEGQSSKCVGLLPDKIVFEFSGEGKITGHSVNDRQVIGHSIASNLESRFMESLG
jgi:hypothetical protein